jgi:hypothetical protein
MPIEITPVELEFSEPKTFSADKIHVVSMVIDGSGLDQVPPSAHLSLKPYAVINDKNVYASSNQNLTTSDIYSASGRIPEIAMAMGAVFNAVQAWSNYNALRQADVDRARSELDAAQGEDQIDALRRWEKAVLALADPANEPVTFPEPQPLKKEEPKKEAKAEPKKEEEKKDEKAEK